MGCVGWSFNKLAVVHDDDVDARGACVMGNVWVGMACTQIESVERECRAPIEKLLIRLETK